MSKRITLLLIFLLNLFISCSHDNRLVDAARDGQTDKIRQLLKDGEDVNEKDHDAKTEHGRTPLMRAAQKGHTDTVRVLVETGADINAICEELGRTALMWAAESGQTETVKELLEMGADPNIKSYKGGWTALMVMAR